MRPCSTSTAAATSRAQRPPTPTSAHASRDPTTLAGDAHSYPSFSDLSHLPPTLVQVGGRDILLSDAERLAARAAEQGRKVDLQVWPEMWHVRHSAAPLLPEANAAIHDAAAWVRLHL